MYQPASKGTILIPTGPVKHLHFVCCDPVFYPSYAKDSVLVVNISTVRMGLEHDETCILNVGDHPFVVQPSYVYYAEAQIAGCDTISRNVAAGTFNVHQPCSDETFRRILGGFSVSDYVTPKILKFYERYCNL
ncbi:hypothetical protein [Vibrio cholerae]|uniref:hypothetical protein n=1 Tax=Vibrio cholerae TaxID=666 RepID=UPI0019316AFA|nr:hypothetical protein [Vibrio cholerae]